MWLDLGKPDGEVEDEAEEELEYYLNKAKRYFFYKCGNGPNWEDRAEISKYKKKMPLKSDYCVLAKEWW